jgi:Cu2+-exporting ATPase
MEGSISPVLPKSMSGFHSWFSSLPAARASDAGVRDVPSAACFHCGLPMRGDTGLRVEFEGQARPVCCAGCLALFEMVMDNGFSDYYCERQVRAGGA